MTDRQTDIFARQYATLPVNETENTIKSFSLTALHFLFIHSLLVYNNDDVTAQNDDVTASKHLSLTSVEALLIRLSQSSRDHAV